MDITITKVETDFNIDEEIVKLDNYIIQEDPELSALLDKVIKYIKTILGLYKNARY
jgi:hypothetical protein